jgi:hypothetical protein
MLLPLNIEVKKHWLAADKSDVGIRKFRRTTSGLVELPDMLWRNTIHAAAMELGISIEKDSFRFPEGVAVDTSEYERVYNRINKERFESIEPGTVIRLRLLLETEADQETMLRVMDLCGELYGLSPWGNKFGYGRFTVLR